MPSFVKRVSLAFCLACTVCAVPSLYAQTNKAAAGVTNKPASVAKAPAEKSPASKPQTGSASIAFHGNVVAVDKIAKTIQVDSKRTLQVTSDTKLYKGDKPATLADGAVGEYITGSYRKTEDGKLIARNLYFGGKSKGNGSEKKKEK